MRTSKEDEIMKTLDGLSIEELAELEAITNALYTVNKVIHPMNTQLKPNYTMDDVLRELRRAHINEVYETEFANVDEVLDLLYGKRLFGRDTTKVIKRIERMTIR